MSNAKSQVSPATKLRRVRKDAKKQLEAKSNEITDLMNRLETSTSQLQSADSVIDSQRGLIHGQRDWIFELVDQLEQQEMKAKACFGIIKAIATEKVTKNDIIVLVTHLATIAPDELLTAAKSAFKADLHR